MKRQDGSGNDITDKTGRKRLPKAGASETENPETPAEKIKRRGHENLNKMFSNQCDFQESLAEQIRTQRGRRALLGEIEKIIRDPEFYKPLVPRDLIILRNSLDASNQRWMVLGQKFLTQEEAFHTYNKLMTLLVSIEMEKEPMDPDLPYSPEFRARVREAYANRVLGRTSEPENHDNEEEENGGEEVDEPSTEDPESGD